MVELSDSYDGGVWLALGGEWSLSRHDDHYY